MSDVHPTAIVATGAQLGKEVSIGPHTVIEDDVQIGDGTTVASSVLIADGARIGKNVKISHGAVIATEPQDLKFGGEETHVSIGDNTVIREYVTINRGTKAYGTTTVGKDCLIMSYAHVAHDCILGNNVIMANSVNLAGHIEIHDHAIIGGLVPIHQFVRIGTHSMVGGGFRVPMDVCPFALVGGLPLKVIGLNAVGLKRRGFSREAISVLQKTFKMLFSSGLNTSQAVKRIVADIEPLDEVRTVLEFIERSERGLCK